MSKSIGLVKRSNVSNLVQPKPWLIGTTSGSGVAVNRNSSLLLSAVYRSIDLISSSIASMPILIYQQTGDTRVTQKDHPFYYALNTSPYPYSDAYQARQQMIVHLLTNGNAYARIVKDGRGRTAGFEVLDASITEPQMLNGEKIYYTFITSSQMYDTAVTLRDEDVIHIKMFDYQGLKGISPIQKAMRERIGLGLASQRQQSKVYREGTLLRGILSSEQIFQKEDQLERARKRWKELYSTGGAGGDIAVLDGGWKFNRITLTPEEAQFIESNKFTVDDIGRFYGVPSTLLNNLDNASYNNVENLQIEFLTYNIRPLAEKIECQLRAKCFTNIEIAQGYQVEHDLDAFLRADMKSRGEFYRQLFNIAAISPNEIRRREGLNPYDDGQRMYAPLNMIPTDMMEAVLLKDKVNASSTE